MIAQVYFNMLCINVLNIFKDSWNYTFSFIEHFVNMF